VAGVSEAELLRLSASVERASEHPLGFAIVAAAEQRGLDLAAVAEFDSPTGKGATGLVENRRVVLGNAAFLQSLGIDGSALVSAADDLRRDGATVIFAGIDGELAGIFAIADPVKATTAEALARLAKEGTALPSTSRCTIRPAALIVSTTSSVAPSASNSRP
jgi:Cu+-exporting ATPase